VQAREVPAVQTEVSTLDVPPQKQDRMAQTIGIAAVRKRMMISSIA
jgi:hypothetical protein